MQVQVPPDISAINWSDVWCVPVWAVRCEEEGEEELEEEKKKEKKKKKKETKKLFDWVHLVRGN